MDTFFYFLFFFFGGGGSSKCLTDWEGLCCSCFQLGHPSKIGMNRTFQILSLCFSHQRLGMATENHKLYHPVNLKELKYLSG